MDALNDTVVAVGRCSDAGIGGDVVDGGCNGRELGAAGEAQLLRAIVTGDLERNGGSADPAPVLV